jgi:hypothetical protein
MANTIKDCCRQDENLGAPERYNGRDDLTFRRCRVCQCRHFRALALPDNATAADLIRAQMHPRYAQARGARA